MCECELNWQVFKSVNLNTISLKSTVFECSVAVFPVIFGTGRSYTCKMDLYVRILLATKYYQLFAVFPFFLCDIYEEWRRHSTVLCAVLVFSFACLFVRRLASDWCLTVLYTSSLFTSILYLFILKSVGTCMHLFSLILTVYIPRLICSYNLSVRSYHTDMFTCSSVIMILFDGWVLPLNHRDMSRLCWRLVLFYRSHCFMTSCILA